MTMMMLMSMYTNRLIIDSEENDDWMKTLPGYKDELALFDSINVFKGGTGSGNFGHSGRPGLVGGSGSGVGSVAIYHASEIDNITDIIEGGLVVGRKSWFGRPQSVYYVTDKDEALKLAIDYIAPASRFIIVQASVPKSLLSDAFIDKKGNSDFEITSAMGISRNIPSEYVKQVYVYERIGSTYATDASKIKHSRTVIVNDGEVVDVVNKEEFITIYVVYIYTGDDNEEFKQLPINDKSKSNLIQIRTNIFYDYVEVLAEQVYTGEVTIGAWEESMKQAIRGVSTSVAAIAKGGWDEMTFAEWGRLGTPLRNQYKYLHGFAETIFAKKDTISLNAIKARARLYGNAGGYVANLMVAGASIAEQLKFIPRDGTTSCLVSCKCFWSLEVIDVLENGVQVVECIWRLTPAEHCEATDGGYDNGGKDGCVDRNGMTQIIRVDASVKVPSMIGGE